MNVDALHFWYSNPNKPVALFNRNISPKGDCIKVVNGYVFITWFKGGMQDRHLMLSRQKIGSSRWVTIQFPERQTLYTRVYKGIDYANSPGGDSHRTASVGISTLDGTVHLVYDHHSDELNYRGSKKNIAFAPDAEFKLANFNAERDYFKAGEVISSCTYPSFTSNDAGELVLDYRIGGTRRGNLMTVYYGRDGWSNSYKIINGRDPNPTFNLYGGIRYFNGKMYLGGTLRIMNSPVGFNQGFYFGEAGQRGNERWKPVRGASKPIPLTDMAPFKIAEPLPRGSDGMTSAPSWVVTESGAVHFANRVSGEGLVSYHKAAGSNTFVRSTGGSSVSFSADERVYSVELTRGNIEVRSTPEGRSSWRTDYVYDARESFALMEHVYYRGKLYIVASEEKDSDKRPLHHIVIDLGITTTPPPPPNPPAGNAAPTVTLLSPTGNQTVTAGYGELEVVVEASDRDGTVSDVKLYVDNRLVRQENTAPYRWNQSGGKTELLGLSVGNHQFRAVATDDDGATAEKSFTLTVRAAGGGGGPTPPPPSGETCAFNTPLDRGLPAYADVSYANIHVLGDGGPAMGSFREFTINWEPRYNGLYQFAISTDNGRPGWHVDLGSTMGFQLKNARPEVTIRNSGFPNLDGAYWIAPVGRDLALVSKAGAYTIYFSNSAAAPKCEGFVTGRSDESHPLEVYPNPVTSALSIRRLPVGTSRFTLLDVQGRSVLSRAVQQGEDNLRLDVADLAAGLYLVRIQATTGEVTTRFIKE